MLSTVLLLILGLYLLLMLAYIIGWYKQPFIVYDKTYEPHTSITVLIPARNEALNIKQCIDSILAQHYDKSLLQIIVIDDHSTDDTVSIVQSYNNSIVSCLQLADYLQGKPVNAYKKAALTLGVTNATGELIVTTDADCYANKYWLASIAQCYERSKPDMIVAPVVYDNNNSWLHIFQTIDFMGMQAITAATQSLGLGSMSNGANLAYRKSAFIKVDGYNGMDHLASGDDYLLTVKIKKLAQGGVVYLKCPDAIVHTSPQPTWDSFLQQRIRWASKSGKYNDKLLTASLALMFIYNALMPILLIVGAFQKFWAYNIYWHWAALFFVTKVVAEFIFMLPVVSFFDKSSLRKYLPFMHPMHIVYVMSAGIMGIIGNYKWKDRKVK